MDGLFDMWIVGDLQELYLVHYRSDGATLFPSGLGSGKDECGCFYGGLFAVLKRPKMVCSANGRYAH